MAKNYITILSHFLDEKGNLPTDIHPAAQEMGLFLATITERVSSAIPCIDTGVKCVLRKRCRGDIVGSVDGYLIRWICMKCGDNGTIADWQGSQWDKTNKIVK